MTRDGEYRIEAGDLRVLERIYGGVVRYHEGQQMFVCGSCRAQRTLHREDCLFRALGGLIERLQRQESEGSMEEGAEARSE